MFGEKDYLIVSDTGATQVPEKGRKINLRNLLIYFFFVLGVGIGFGVLFDRIPSFIGIIILN